MRLFVLLSRVPWPLEKGDKLRAYHQLKLLAKDHKIFLCCLSDKKIDRESIDHLRTIIPDMEIIYLKRYLILWRMISAVFSSRPFQIHYFFQRRAALRVQSLIESFKPDHIYCQLIRTSEYVKNLHQYKKTLDYMDALSAGFKRRADNSGIIFKFLFEEEAKRLKAYENLIFDYFEHHTIISDQDRQLIFHPDRNRIAVIPNGVDTSFFQPSATERKYELVFTGNMSYAPNIACVKILCNEILPIVRRKYPHIKLLIAGAGPSSEVRALQNANVIVSGWMEDIREAYSSAEIFVAPMFTGSGMQNKLLEAMSMSLPCITSPLAAAAFRTEADKAMIVAGDINEFAGKIIFLLSDHSERKRLGKAGRDLVAGQYGWGSTVESLNEIFLA